MRSVAQKICIIIASVFIAFISSKIESNIDFLWSIRGAIIPVLMTLMTLYVTLSMNLINSLVNLPKDFHEKAFAVLDAIKKEMKLELILLILTFLLVLLFPLLKCASLSVVCRCIIDGLIVFDVVHFIISIMDTFFGYIDLMKSIHS